MLTSGTRLGAYEIVSPLGAGGMGEVYRARDTRLDRIVAIKILPQGLAGDPQFRERFDREARAISQLDHPHICALYDIGEESGTAYLVMQYLEGETLAERLTKGAMPIDLALRVAIEIAGALDKAHRSGIVHRDLKPGNVMLTKSGAKLLDFGLAKVSGPAVASTDVSALPTTPRGITQQGTILGTFQYMAPEQVEGQEADARSDIFAFGCVLYEIVTGRRAFDGKSAASVMAAILEREPPSMASLQPLAPPHLDHIVTRCLAKNPDERWQTASDVLQELKWASVPASSATGMPRVAPARARTRGWMLGAVGLALGAAAASAVWMVLPTEDSELLPVGRLQIDTPRFTGNGINSAMAVSRDGRTFLYDAPGDDGIRRLYARPLGQLESVAIRGTENASNASLSPDGAWVAFVAGGQLKKVAIGGGLPSTLCDVPDGLVGTDWQGHAAIIFGTPRGGIMRVPAGGGTPEIVAAVDEASKNVSYRWPHVLPDGESVVFTVWSGAFATAQVAIASLESREVRTLVPGSYPRVTPGGHLLFSRAQSLWAMAFDSASMAVEGEAVPVLEDLVTLIDGRSMYDVSADGMLVYKQLGAAAAGSQRLVWIKRDGVVSFAVNEELNGVYHGPPQLSPDGRVLAVTIHPAGGGDQIVLYDLARDIRTPMNGDPKGNSRYPVWAPDGARLTFGSTVAGTWDLYSVEASGTGTPEALVVRPGGQFPLSWSPDGQVLAFQDDSDIWMLPRGGAPSAFLATPSDEGQAAFAPDGRWIAFRSDESQRNEVYVTPYPGPGAKIRVSTNGGTAPVWSRDGNELFYREGERVMAVRVQGTGTLTIGRPQPLALSVQILDGEGFDVAADGARFIAIENTNTVSSTLVVVQNWLQELRQKMPAP